MKYALELVVVPVSDVDQAKQFYIDKVGFTLDNDHRGGDQDFRVVQLTPPGSACSIAIGNGITDSRPGTYKGMHLVVDDIQGAHTELTDRGVTVSPIRHMGPAGWVPGPDPSHADFNSFADFADPDGNVWVLQEVRYAKGDS